MAESEPAPAVASGTLGRGLHFGYWNKGCGRRFQHSQQELPEVNLHHLLTAITQTQVPSSQSPGDEDPLVLIAK
jgi:hypothetical protein